MSGQTTRIRNHRNFTKTLDVAMINGDVGYYAFMKDVPMLLKRTCSSAVLERANT
jgi:hypothetical protein